MRAKSQPVAAARLVLLLACGAAFLSLLDATVVNLAVADLHADFATASLTGLSWVITAYAVLFAATLALAAGWSTRAVRGRCSSLASPCSRPARCSAASRRIWGR